MSFSSNGVKFKNRSRWVNPFFRLFIKSGEAVLSVLFAISLAAPIIFPQDVYAAVGTSKILSYQGRLTDASGTPSTGSFCFNFSIYTAASAGTKVWPAGTPSTMSATVTNGVFNLGIGDIVSGGDDLANSNWNASYPNGFADIDTTYLNIDVATRVGPTCAPGDGAETFESLTPRQRVDAVAYARVAEGVYGDLLKTDTTNRRVQIGQAEISPVLLLLGVKNTADATLSYVGQACSVSGTVWYNSASTRALACVSGTVVGVDNKADLLGIKESAAGSTVNAGSIILSNAGGISISQSTATLATNQTNQIIGTFGFSNLNAEGISTMGNTLGTNGTGTGSVYWAGGNNITLSQVTAVGARTITIIGPSAGGIPGIAGSGASTITNGTLQFANANGVTFGLNGSTMTASVAAAGAGPAVSRLMWPTNNAGLSAITAPAQGTMSVQFFPIGEQLTASRMDVAMSFALGSSAIANTAGVAISQTVGIYSKNANTLMSMSTSSNQQTISWASNTGSYLSINGMRLLSSPININATPGDYYVIYNVSTAQSSLGTATTALAPGMSIFGATMATAGIHATNWGIIGSTQNMYGGMGVYSAQVATAPGNLSLSAINQTGTWASKANFWVQLRNI